MAGSSGQGTGKHPHKSTEEPYPHNEAPTTSRSHSGGSHKESHSSESHGKSGQHASSHNEESGRSQRGSESDSSDLKSREYTDAQGNVHHHTKTYQEQHKEEHGKK